jgi:hypothetical protein
VEQLQDICDEDGLPVSPRAPQPHRVRISVGESSTVPRVVGPLPRVRAPEKGLTRKLSQKQLKLEERARRKAEFEKRHGEEIVRVWAKQAEMIAVHSRRKLLRTRYVLVPGKTRFLARWDIVATLALTYTAILTPFEASFLGPSNGSAAWQDPWFIINRALDCVFILDLILQFFIAYEDRGSRGDTGLVIDHPKIIQHYLQTWFPLDAFTIIVPCILDFYVMSLETTSNTSPESASDLQSVHNLNLLRTLRCIRLVKLVRLVRASRVFMRIKAQLTLSIAQMAVMQIFFMLLGSAHWFACIMALQASLHPSPQLTWIGKMKYDFCDEYEVGSGRSNAITAESSAIAVSGCATLDVGTWYWAAFSWSVLVITGTGGTDHYPSSDSIGETVLVTALVLLGALLWTQVLATFCDVATNSNPGLTHFRQQLDSLNEFVAFNNLPVDMARRMREYLQQQKNAQMREYAARVMPRLSTALQVEVVLHCHRHWLDRVWFLKNVEMICRVRLAMSMSSQVLAPGEVAPCRQLYIIVRGVVLFGGKILSQSTAWGDDVLLSDGRYFLPFLARAMCYTDLHKISHDEFHQVLECFPESAEKIRRVTIVLALKRHMIADYRRRRLIGQWPDVKEGDFLDQIGERASEITHKELKRAERERQLRETQMESVSMAVTLHNKEHEMTGSAAILGDTWSPGVTSDDTSQKQMKKDLLDLKTDMKLVKDNIMLMKAMLEKTMR